MIEAQLIADAIDNLAGVVLFAAVILAIFTS